MLFPIISQSNREITMKINIKLFKSITFPLISSIMLTACGGGSSSNTSSMPPPATPVAPSQPSAEPLLFESVNNGRVEVSLGETISLNHIATGADSVTYTSSKYTVASVHPTTGDVFINSPGTTTISAWSDNWQSNAEYELVVNEPIEDAFMFPGAVLNVSIYDGPFNNWVVDAPPGSEPIIYGSSNIAVASVDSQTGLLTINGRGEAVISATRLANNSTPEQSTSYQLRVYSEEDIQDRTVRIADGGHRIEVNTTYSSGYTEIETETVGFASQFSTCAIEGVDRNVEVLVRFVLSSDKSLFTDRCLVIEDLSPQPDRRRLLNQGELDQVFSGDPGFTPTYLNNHGSAEVTQRAVHHGTEFTTVYESGMRETTVIERFKENQTIYDYTGDGDRNDYIMLTTVSIDGHMSQRNLQVTDGMNGHVTQELGIVQGNPPRRIQMPQDYPGFLRFNGDLNNLKVHVKPANNPNQYYVKLDKLDSDTELVVYKQEPFSYTEQRSDFFDRTILLDIPEGTSYSIYVVTNNKYVVPVASHPNFFVKYETENVLLPTIIKTALDRNKQIVEGANLAEFTQYYNSIRIEHSVYDAVPSHYFGGKVILGGGDPYRERVLIHEVAHGYHDNLVADGVDNQEVIDLYNLVPHDIHTPYGDEQNSYWRTNKFEFFAELLTTYIYLSSSEGDDDFAISQVDSSFYYTHAQPYFDRLFGK